MASTFEQSQDAIAALVKHFSTNHAAFHAADYKEAHARNEFIDPLFIALGWDVHNDQHAAARLVLECLVNRGVLEKVTGKQTERYVLPSNQQV